VAYQHKLNATWHQPQVYLSNVSTKRIHATANVRRDYLHRGHHSESANIVVNSRRIRMISLHPVTYMFDCQLLTQTVRCTNTWACSILSISIENTKVDHYSRLLRPFFCPMALYPILATSQPTPFLTRYHLQEVRKVRSDIIL